MTRLVHTSFVLEIFTPRAREDKKKGTSENVGEKAALFAALLITIQSEDYAVSLTRGCSSTRSSSEFSPHCPNQHLWNDVTRGPLTFGEAYPGSSTAAETTVSTPNSIEAPAEREGQRERERSLRCFWKRVQTNFNRHPVCWGAPIHDGCSHAKKWTCNVKFLTRETLETNNRRIHGIVEGGWTPCE